ncbi:hypothetical protein ASPBRDRAFT_511701 [Aspergillus brasiliensis CBS 101740]|uniref:ABC transmembrane type-1 domain-containing protein n=1 Tax=Aspergillus brasiliensis (strain CBS 101740 / IMI 381727 / IBT 21946) TaxID=767769 RepID=A0A1L9UPS8_ASPBC|nr:hypothetical protein ASPBRDRAFT_511701 [Aspergillus brasiliensis CBS 101740]
MMGGTQLVFIWIFFAYSFCKNINLQRPQDFSPGGCKEPCEDATTPCQATGVSSQQRNRSGCSASQAQDVSLWINFNIMVGTVELSFPLSIVALLGLFHLFLFAGLFISIYVVIETQVAALKAFLANMEPKSTELVAVSKNMNLAIDAKVSLFNGVKKLFGLNISFLV